MSSEIRPGWKRLANWAIPGAAGIIAVAAGCKAPTVNLATGEPIKVDINMRLDVYQYSSTTTPANGSTPNGTPASAATVTTPSTEQTRRRNRMADIQAFKNQGLAGEAHDGLLVILKAPAGDYGDYVQKTVKAENVDRMALMQKQADSDKTSLQEVQKKQAEVRRNMAFKGEMIEIQQPDGSWKWVAKEG